MQTQGEDSITDEEVRPTAAEACFLPGLSVYLSTACVMQTVRMVKLANREKIKENNTSKAKA